MLRLNLLVLATSLGLAGAQQGPRPPRAAALPAAPAPMSALALPLAPGLPMAPVAPAFDRSFATLPPAARFQGDPADSVYKLARERLNQGDYRRAADLFRLVADRYPKSAYAPDALYWEAFALYRTGSTSELRAAVAILREQQRRFPNAATRGDAEALLTRINGELARGGDADAAESIAEAASAAAEAALANVDLAQVGAEAARAAAEAMKVALPQAMEATRQALQATAGAMQGAGPGRKTPLPPECAGQEEKFEMRTAALNALMQMDADQAVPVLRDVLKRRDACSAPLRRQAVFILAQKRSPEMETLMVDLVRNDPDAGVRQAALFWLSEVHTPAALKAIEDVLANSNDPAMQEKALFALSHQHDPEATAAMRRFASDPKVQPELRQKAIFWVGQSASPESAEFLRQLFRQSTDPTVKERALFSLSQMHDAETARFLVDIAKDQSQPANVRKQALFWASQSGAFSAADLSRLYDTAPDLATRQQVLFALGQRKDGVDKLLEIARTEKDPSLRSKAVFWLGQSRDPRVLKLLQEIVNQ